MERCLYSKPSEGQLAPLRKAHQRGRGRAFRQGALKICGSRKHLNCKGVVVQIVGQTVPELSDHRRARTWAMPGCCRSYRRGRLHCTQSGSSVRATGGRWNFNARVAQLKVARDFLKMSPSHDQSSTFRHRWYASRQCRSARPVLGPSLRSFRDHD